MLLRVPHRGWLRVDGPQHVSGAVQNPSVGMLARLVAVRDRSGGAQGGSARLQGQVAIVQWEMGVRQWEMGVLQWVVAIVQGEVAIVQRDVATVQGEDATVQDQVAIVQGEAAVGQGEADAAVVRTGQFYQLHSNVGGHHDHRPLFEF